MRVQQLVRLVPERLAEEFLVEFRHRRIVVRFAQLLGFVLGVDRGNPLEPDAVVREARLPAAADASTYGAETEGWERTELADAS